MPHDTRPAVCQSSFDAAVTGAVKTRSSGESVRPFATVIVAFALVAVGFVAAALATEVWASRIDREAQNIETNALPSVEHLAAARDALWHLEIASQQYVNAAPERRAAAVAGMQASRQDLTRELASEFATDRYPGEAEYDRDVEEQLGRLDGLLAGIPRVIDHDETSAQALMRHDGRRAFEQVDQTLHRLMTLNAQEGHREALRIAGVRTASVRLSFALTAACVLLAVLAGVVAVRALQRKREIELAHEELLSTRSSELERFAARVAHDLLSPLSALHFSLSSVRRNADKGLPVADLIGRAEACLKRSRSLVDGVMEFARSGATLGTARASLLESVEGVLEEVHADASGIEFSVVGIDENAFVACSPGVLTSILSNLVRNAVKYMDDRPERRVTLRAEMRDALVHVEVADTGPGLPPGLEAHVFDAYVRGPDNPKPGLGLGLATVQRFVSAHGGRVGVESSPDRGCVFWFDMPGARASSLESSL